MAPGDENEADESPGEVASRFAEHVKHLADILDLDEDSLEDDAIELGDDELDLVLEEQDAAGAVLNIEYEGATYEVGDGRFVIGRATDSCSLKIVDANVSRHHCAIERVEGSYVIRDLGSTNGIEIAGKKVQDHRIQDGDAIVISGHQLRCSFSAPTQFVEAVGSPLADEDPPVPVALITQRLEPAPPATETVIGAAPTAPTSQDHRAAFEERLEVRLDAMARELADLRGALERMAEQFESLTVEAMGRLLQSRVEQARRNAGR